MNKAEIAKAFAAGKSGKCHNAHTDGSVYTLHRSQIVRRVGDEFVFDWCGWHTVTTASHMNEVLRAIGANMRVSAARHRDETVTTFSVTVQ